MTTAIIEDRLSETLAALRQFDPAGHSRPSCRK